MIPSHRRPVKRESNSSNPTSETTGSGSDTKKGSSRVLIDYSKRRGDGRQSVQKACNDERSSALSWWQRLSPDLPTEITILVRPRMVKEKTVVTQTNTDDVVLCHVETEHENAR